MPPHAKHVYAKRRMKLDVVLLCITTDRFPYDHVCFIRRRASGDGREWFALRDRLVQLCREEMYLPAINLIRI
ncbi:hypothetical protein CERZMDRAFT_91942 [Cercospora zeae-maydis SCOH1-5]|uniref:Uncharacterized protein n=1 Tax=Cercospora zeae-maydis SCOH1-5 TaxID=717836 RepID=A0A6A6EYU0_9PEZI|nr:hypothetical protein CERZMDRAFT_91942 [Cercospora zeae-maydis SCOH1-5]